MPGICTPPLDSQTDLHKDSKSKDQQSCKFTTFSRFELAYAYLAKLQLETKKKNVNDKKYSNANLCIPPQLASNSLE